MERFPESRGPIRIRLLYPGLAGCIGLTAALCPPVASAHDDVPPTPETIWSSWNVDPVIVLSLAFGLWLYVRGLRMLWGRAGRNRGIRYVHVAAAMGGFLAVAVALISPLDPLSGALFSAHMVQHLLLIAVAAPLFIVANMNVSYIWALPKSWRRYVGDIQCRVESWQGVWNLVARPIPIILLHSAMLWAWHTPALYVAALRSNVIHAIEHATLFGAALLFWWLVLRRGRRAGIGYGLGLIALFSMVLQGTALGALMTFSATPWYPEYASSAEAWGLTVLDDQQLAGAVMLVPGGMVYVIAGLILFAGWLRAIERSVNREESQAAAYLTPRASDGRNVKETA